MVISQIDAFIEGKSIIVVICSFRNNNAQHLIRKKLELTNICSLIFFFAFLRLSFQGKLGKISLQEILIAVIVYGCI